MIDDLRMKATLVQVVSSPSIDKAMKLILKRPLQLQLVDLVAGRKINRWEGLSYQRSHFILPTMLNLGLLENWV